MSDHQFEVENITRGIQRSSGRVQVKNDPNKDIKYAIWAYFLLLIFEGALRKWFLPFLATPLLLIRDPIAIWIILRAIKRNLFPSDVNLILILFIGIISIFTAVLVGHGNLLVALYGARPYIFHVPFMFIMGKVLNEDDVIKMGKVLLWISIPMTILIALQFYSPQTSFVNRGVGGDESGAGFSGALGYFRPPGTFSFTNGTTLFYGLVSCFVFYFWIKNNAVNRYILIISTFCLIAAIPLSISRGLLFSISVIALFVIFGTVRNPKYIFRIIGSIVGLLLIFFILSNTSIFETATQAFIQRFDNASQSEGGLQGTLGKRYLGALFDAFSFSQDLPVLGYGSGIYTNVGSKLLTGKVIAGIAEGEWGRMIAEVGPVLGTMLILSRSFISVDLLIKSYKKLSFGKLLPWILLPYSLLEGSQANWAQPTSLGFSIFIIGLVMASLNNRRLEKRNLTKIQID